MKPIRFFIFLFIPFLCSSCMYRNMYHLSENDMKWVEVYNVGDTITFPGSQDVDTLIIVEKVVNETNSPFIENEGQMGDDFRANAYIEGTFIHQLERMKFSLLIIKNDKIRDAILWFVAGQRYGLGIEDTRNQLTDGFYRDTIIIDNENSEYGYGGPSKCEFEYYIWSKSEGLIEYILTDGNKYVKE